MERPDLPERGWGRRRPGSPPAAGWAPLEKDERRPKGCPNPRHRPRSAVSRGRRSRPCQRLGCGYRRGVRLASRGPGRRTRVSGWRPEKALVPPLGDRRRPVSGWRQLAASAVPSVVALQKPAFDSPPLAAAQEVPAPAGLRLACDWSWAGGTEAVPTPAALRRLGGGWRRVETVRAGLQRLACDWRRLEVQGVPASAGLRKPASGWMGEACLVEPGGSAPLGDGRSRSWASAC